MPSTPSSAAGRRGRLAWSVYLVVLVRAVLFLGSGERLLDALGREMRRLRKGHRPQSGRLKNADGNVVESDQRAETLANYFESVQWAPLATTEPPHSTRDDPLLVSNTSISEAEVVESVKSLKRRKAAGSDGIPPVFWKAIYAYTSPACRRAVLLCNKVWTEGSVPTSWHEATAAAIFKKGDPACC